MIPDVSPTGNDPVKVGMVEATVVEPSTRLGFLWQGIEHEDLYREQLSSGNRNQARTANFLDNFLFFLMCTRSNHERTSQILTSISQDSYTLIACSSPPSDKPHVTAMQHSSC